MRRNTLLTLLFGIWAMGAMAQDSKVYLPEMKFSEPEKLSVNSDEHNDILPVLFPDEKTIVFSRRNHPDNAGGVDDRVDVWFATRDTIDSEWSEPLRQGQYFNNADYNFVSSIAGDATHLILGNMYNTDGTMAQGPSVTYWNGIDWDWPKKVEIEGFSNTSVQYNFNLSRDGNILLMSIQKEGDENREIYVSFKIDQNEYTWTEPLSLGPDINTSADDVTPYLSADNKTLFFSTSGIADGLGEEDIYVSYRKDDTWQSWTKPRNLGAPVNTPASDMYWSMNAEESRGYFSRGESDEQADIYVTTISRSILATIMLVDKGTGQPISGTVKYMQDGEEVTIETSEDPDSFGTFQMELEPGETFSMSGASPGYQAGSSDIGVPADFEGSETTQAIELEPTPAMARLQQMAKRGLLDMAGDARKIDLKNVLFDVGKHKLRPESFPVLDEAYETLAAYGDVINIRVEGHTDNTGGRKLNERLSTNRARVVAEYLINKGLNSELVSYKGYAWDRPIAPNDTKENRQKNRRTEIYIDDRY